MKRTTTRLKFKEDDLKDKKTSDAAKKAERAADKADKAKKRLYREHKLTAEPSSAVSHKKKLKFENARIEKPSDTVRSIKRAPASVVSAKFHQEVSRTGDDNVGVQAAEQSESLAEGTLHTTGHASYSRKLKAYDKAEKLETKADKAGVEALYQKSLKDNPEATTNPVSRWRQRQAIKQEYAAMRAGKTDTGVYGASATEAGKGVFGGTKEAVKEGGTLTEKAAEFVKNHSGSLILMLAVVLLLMIVVSSLSSCSILFQSGVNVTLGASFTAEDDDISGVEEDYSALEAALRNEIDNIESTHSGYDEYRYTLDEINHNPYELAAYLTVILEDYAREEVQDILQQLFEQQYTLTLEEEVEIRTRTETRTVHDPVTGESSTEEYEVEYEYYILNVTLTNNGLGSVVSAAGLTDDQMERYELLLTTYGNRAYLFADDIYAVSAGEYLDYDIPGEALTDTAFANMIREAEKYLGYAYVWGGSSPSMGFDCSGYVCWVLNYCGNGWDVGRTTANGLLSYCDVITADEAQPGDLIFFQGTYGTGGVSHVGIYVGNGMMIHCGNPISYASIETTYWQEHFYCFGRLK